MKMTVTIKELNELMYAIDHLDYDDYMNSYLLLYNKMSSIVSRFILLKGTINEINVPYVFRTRENFNSEIFCKEEQLSFNTNYPIIKLSRANLPYQSTFYATLPVKTEFANHTLSSILEAGKLYYDPFEDNSTKYYTQSSWKIIKPFEVVILCFNEDAIKKNKLISNSFESWSKEIASTYPDDKIHVNQFLKNMSDTFCGSTYGLPPKDIIKRYVVSTSFYNSIIANANVHGLLYSSASTESASITLACPPCIAKNFLKIEKAVMYKAYKNKNTNNRFSVEQCSNVVNVNDGKFIFDKLFSYPQLV